MHLFFTQSSLFKLYIKAYIIFSNTRSELFKGNSLNIFKCFFENFTFYVLDIFLRRNPTQNNFFSLDGSNSLSVVQLNETAYVQNILSTLSFGVHFIVISRCQ